MEFSLSELLFQLLEDPRLSLKSLIFPSLLKIWSFPPHKMIVKLWKRSNVLNGSENKITSTHKSHHLDLMKRNVFAVLASVLVSWKHQLLQTGLTFPSSRPFLNPSAPHSHQTPLSFEPDVAPLSSGLHTFTVSLAVPTLQTAAVCGFRGVPEAYPSPMCIFFLGFIVQDFYSRLNPFISSTI